MQSLESEAPFAAISTAAFLRLVVRNHPGVMSHVCGLFSRRAFNVEAIVCVPLADTARSVIVLGVNENGDARLEQMIRQLRKLEDVLEVEAAPGAAPLFAALSRHVAST